MLRYRLIHTGQHYDRAMSDAFFEQLGIPEPDINLEVGSGSQAEQTAAIMMRYEKLLSKERSELCLVVGDVNSTMACAIVARKLGVLVAMSRAAFDQVTGRCRKKSIVLSLIQLRTGFSSLA